VPKHGSSTDGSEGSQDQTGPRSGTSIFDKAKPSSEGGSEEAAAEQDKAQGEKMQTRIEVEANS
jgi:hypothetical protein